MNYRDQAKEYRKSAENVSRTIKAYQKRLNDKSVNRERLNSIIAHYKGVKSDLLHIAQVLENKAKTIEIREELHQQVVNEVKLCAGRLQSKT